MDQQQILQFVAIGVEVADRVAQLIAELMKQGGISDEQLRQYTLDKDQALRDKVDAFLARVKTQG